MDQNATPDPQQPVFAPPAPPLLSDTETLASPHARRRIGTGVAVAAVAVGALGLGGIAYAANASTTTPSPTPSSNSGQNSPRYGAQGNAPAQGQGGMRHHMGAGMGGGFGGGIGMGLGGAIHGSIVTPKQGGGYQTIDGQRGAVLEVSATSIKVRSDDGFTATYIVTADTVVNATRDGIGSVKVGDKVGVMGVEAAGSTTAVRIIDETALKASGQKWMPQGSGKNAPSNGSGTPSGSSGSSGTA